MILDRNILAAALTKVEPLIPNGDIAPVVKHIKITAGKGGKALTLTTTNFDSGIAVTLEVECGGWTDCCVPGRMLRDIVKNLPEGSQVELAQPNPGQVVVRSNTGAFTLHTLDAKDFPAWHSVKTPGFAITGGELARIFSQIQPATHAEDTRPHLQSVYLHPVAEGFAGPPAWRAVATDTRILIAFDMPVPVPLEPDSADSLPAPVLLHRSTVGDIARLLEGVDAAQVAMNDALIEVRHGNVTMVAKLLDGEYLNYTQAIPDEDTAQATVTAACAAVQGGLRRVSLACADKKYPKVEVTLTPPDGDGKGEITLTASGETTGDAIERIPGDIVTGDGNEPLSWSYNANFLRIAMDIMGAGFEAYITGDISICCMTDPDNPHTLVLVAGWGPGA